MYNTDNIFFKIVNKQIKCNIICENATSLSFHDINPQAPIHALILPKGKYTDIQDFTINGSAEEKHQFFDLLGETINQLSLKNGFRVIANTKDHGGQEIPHFHMHILGGKKLGKMLSPTQ